MAREKRLIAHDGDETVQYGVSRIMADGIRSGIVCVGRREAYELAELWSENHPEVEPKVAHRAISYGAWGTLDGKEIHN